VRCAAPRQTCCKQRWTLSVINLRQRLRRSTFSSYSGLLSKVANFDLPHLRLAYPLIPVEFCRDLRHQKTRVHHPIRLSASVEHRLVTDRQAHDYGIHRASMASRCKVHCAITPWTSIFSVFSTNDKLITLALQSVVCCRC